MERRFTWEIFHAITVGIAPQNMVVVWSPSGQNKIELAGFKLRQYLKVGSEDMMWKQITNQEIEQSQKQILVFFFHLMYNKK
jgi:hypothetical protein